MIHDNYRYKMEKYGPFTAQVPASAKTLRRMTGMFPATHIEFLASEGIGVWQNGRYQLVDPFDYQDISHMIFAGDPEFDPAETFLIGYSALARLAFWNRAVNDSIWVDLPMLQAEVSGVRFRPEMAYASVSSTIPSFEYGDHDLLDPVTVRPVLDRTLKRLGGLRNGEVLGYLPALALGGGGGPETVEKVSALEHFAFLAQLGDIPLTQTNDRPPATQLRMLGRG